MDRELFETIAEKYGDVASWAVWADAGIKPKSNMGNIEIFDLDKNPSLLGILKTNVVMVALNFSRPITCLESFKNFHDSSPSANDFKIRYAFKGTQFYGAYMTDIIKNLEMKDSKNVLELLKRSPDIVEANIRMFRQELADIRATEPIILAFGSATFELLKKNLNNNEYSKLVKLTHYSHQICKEEYKKEVEKQLPELTQTSITIRDNWHTSITSITNDILRMRRLLESEHRQELSESGYALKMLKGAAMELAEMIARLEKA